MNVHESNLKKLYVASILGGFAFFYNGVETLYYRHFGLTFEQMSLLVSLSLIASLILQIPTGAFADLYDKKKSLLVGSFIMLTGLGFLAFGSVVGWFALGFVLLGAGRAFNSGAASALLFDTLGGMDEQHEYIKHQSRLQSAFVAIDVISGSLGFLLFALNVRLPFIISFAALILVIGVQLTLHENVNRIRSGQHRLQAHLEQIKNGLVIALRNRMIVWLMFFTLIYFVAIKFFSQVIDLPFLTEVRHFTTNQLAVMGFISSSLQAASILVINRIESKIGRRLSIALIVALFSLVLTGMLLVGNYLLMAILFGLFWAAGSFNEIITESYLNKELEDNHRATVLSINAMFSSSVAVIALPVLGRTTDVSGPANGILLIAAGTLVLGGLAALLMPRLMSVHSQLSPTTVDSPPAGNSL